jgi:hypothetical protein
MAWRALQSTTYSKRWPQTSLVLQGADVVLCVLGRIGSLNLSTRQATGEANLRATVLVRCATVSCIVLLRGCSKCMDKDLG